MFQCKTSTNDDKLWYDQQTVVDRLESLQANREDKITH